MLTAEQILTLRRLFNGLCLASLAGSAFTLLTFVLFSIKRQTCGQILTFCFCVCATGLDLAVLISTLFVAEPTHVFESRALCYLQSVSVQFWGCACIAFWFLIALNLFHSVIIKAQSASELPPARVQVAIGFLYGLVMALIPFAGDAYGPHYFFCWIRAGDWAWVYGALYAHMCAVLVVGLYFWVRVVNRVISISRQVVTQRHGGGPQLSVARHLLFVTWFFLVFALMLANETAMRAGYFIFPLWVLHAIALGGTGLSTLVTCGLSKLNFMLWRALFTGRPMTDATRMPLLFSSMPRSPS